MRMLFFACVDALQQACPNLVLDSYRPATFRAALILRT